MPSSEFRERLKHGTDLCHRRVDAAFSRFDLTQEAGLEGFLTAQAAATLPLERALESGSGGGASALIPDWAERRRSHLFAGLDLDVPLLEIAPFEDPARMLGALYVLEGSKLGARFLLKRVAGADGRFGRAAALFLAHDTGRDRWASFLRDLDRQAEALDAAVCLRGALDAFDLFERAATRVANRNDRPTLNPMAAPSITISSGAPD